MSTQKLKKPQVALFIMALVFLIFAFSTAIMALEHELTDFADAEPN